MLSTSDDLTSDDRIYSRDKRNKYIVYVLSTLILLLVIALLVIKSSENLTSYGESLVTNLYTYKDELSRSQQDGFLHNICTDEVYAQVTLKQNGNLYTFIDTAKQLTSVNIIKSTNDYVIYSLNAPQIDPGCRYVLFYKVKNKQVVEVRECELYDFIEFDESMY